MHSRQNQVRIRRLGMQLDSVSNQKLLQVSVDVSFPFYMATCHMFIKYVNGAELHEYKAVKQHCFYEDNDEPTLSYVPENLNTVNNRKPSTRIIITFLAIYKNAYYFCMGPRVHKSAASCSSKDCTTILQLMSSVICY